LETVKKNIGQIFFSPIQMAREIDRANPLFGRAVPVRFTGVEGAEEIRQLTVNVLSGSKVRACAAFRPFFALPNPRATTRV
jgi:hypothetical protein